MYEHADKFSILLPSLDGLQHEAYDVNCDTEGIHAKVYQGLTKIKSRINKKACLYLHTGKLWKDFVLLTVEKLSSIVPIKLCQNMTRNPKIVYFCSHVPQNDVLVKDDHMYNGGLLRL